MTGKNNLSEQAAELRKRAEEIALGKAPQLPESVSPEEARNMLHDLSVHQIELEMQNEELRRAEKELEAARTRYFELYDMAPAGYCTISEKGLVLEANLTAATLLGVPRGALGKQPFSRFILKEDQGIYYQHYKQLFETGELQMCELRMMKKDGTAFWGQLTASATQTAYGATVAHVVLSNVTERKQAEEALHGSEERYAMTLAAVNDGLWDWHIPSGNAFFSALYYTILGYDNGEFPASYSSWRLLVHPDDIDRVEREIRTSTEVGKGFAIDLRMRKKSGEWLWVSTCGKAIELDAGGKALRMVGTLSDITERKQAEEALLASKQIIEGIFNAVPFSVFWKDSNLVHCIS